MIFDTHCHTAEGSPDAYVTLQDTVDILRSKGYNGMLVTDHNSYKGYNSREEYEDFVILRGVEYDTSDGGHMLIVLPTGMDYELFTLRGMSLSDTIKVVHILGGIIGPAHPFDYHKLGVCNNPRWVGKIELLKQFDFIESFNACGRHYGNILAGQLAEYLDKPQLGGSDSHRPNSVGLGKTIFNEPIKTEDDLIRVIKSGNYNTTKVEGKIFDDAMINKHKILFNIGVRFYCLFNNCISYSTQKKRNILLEII